MGLSQLAEQHGDQLFPKGESFGLPFHFGLHHGIIKFRFREYL